MRHWFYHANSETYFLEDENYDCASDDVIMLDYDETTSEKLIEKLHERDTMKGRFNVTNGEVTKPKITNWNDIFTKFVKTHDSWNLKVKHATEEYINLPHAPEIDDILYFMFSKKKSIIELKELLDIFGANRRHMIENSISYMLKNMILLGYSFQNGEFLEEWAYADTDKFSINVNYNGQ